MSDTDWRSVLQTVAPTVATMLGGPLAGMAATLIGRVILGKPAEATTSVEEAQAALATAVSTPEGLARLKEAQNQAEQIKATLQVDIEKIGAGDRADARARQVALRDPMPAIMGSTVVGGFLLLSGFCLYVDPSAATINLVFGYLAGAASSVLAYFFGSTIGSKGKDSQIAAMSDHLAASIPSAHAPMPPAVAAAAPPAPSPAGTTADDLNARSLDQSRGAVSRPLGGSAA